MNDECKKARGFALLILAIFVGAFGCGAMDSPDATKAAYGFWIIIADIAAVLLWHGWIKQRSDM